MAAHEKPYKKVRFFRCKHAVAASNHQAKPVLALGCGQEAPFGFSRDPCRTNLSYGETKVLLAGVSPWPLVGCQGLALSPKYIMPSTCDSLMAGRFSFGVWCWWALANLERCGRVCVSLTIIIIFFVGAPCWIILTRRRGWAGLYLIHHHPKCRATRPAFSAAGGAGGLLL